jgi:O-antigen polymerase
MNNRQLNSIVFLILISSFLFSINLKNFYYIQSTTYIQLALTAGLIPVAIADLFTKHRNYFLKITPVDLVLLAIGTGIFISFLFTSEYNFLIDKMVMVVVWGILYLFVCRELQTDRKEKIIHIFSIVSLLGVMQIIYALLQYAGILPELFYHHYGATFGNSGDLANFLALTYTVTLGLLLLEEKKSRKILWAVSFIIHLLLLGISLSRTAWIAVFISTLYILISCGKLKNFSGKVFALMQSRKWIVPAIVTGVILFIGIAGLMMYGLKPASANGRLFIWEMCLQAMGEKPLFGHGYESFETVVRNTQIEYFAQHPEDFHNGMLASSTSFAFNDFLQIAVEYGVTGSLLLVAILCLQFRKMKSLEQTDKLVIVILKGFFVSLIVCSLSSYPLQNQTILLLFFIFLAIRNSYGNDTVTTIPINRKVIVPIFSVLILLCLFLANFNIKKIENGLKWKQAFNLIKSDAQTSYKIYNGIYDFMKHDRSFLSNYGSILYQLGENDKLVKHYEKFRYLCTSSDILLMIGESYEKLENYPKAEENYRMASNLIPHLFVPRYKLFKLYQKWNEFEKATEEARKISELKIKVYSERVKDIKTEVNEYLYNSTQ